MQDIIIEELEFNNEAINNISNDKLTNFPVVYLIQNDKSIYIGETVKVKSRMKDHLKNDKRKSLTKITIVGSEKFNKSATFNIETNLLNYFIAEEKYKIQNISQTRNNIMHNYYEKDYYDKKLFSNIWDELKSRGYVNNELDYLANKDIYKLSPYRELSYEQLLMKQTIISYCTSRISDNSKGVFLIDGEAGTGKSVLLSSLFNTLLDLTNDKSSTLFTNNANNYILVNHSEMLKTYESLANYVPNIKKKNILKPTSFINKIAENNDENIISIVDEAHLLLTRQDSYNNFKQDNQLEEIIKRSKITIIVFDSKQSLKIKGMWDKKLLDKILQNTDNYNYELENQFRVNANEDTLRWMSELYNKKLLKIPKDNDYELKIFDNANKMYEEIKVKNNEFGLSRVVATFDYEHKKNGDDYYVEEPDFKLPWNREHKKVKKAWAEIEQTINEVGSIYTIQGFDLNYVGVILGPCVQYDNEKKQLKIDSSLYQDTEAFRGSSQLNNEQELKERIILNSINVLIKRGIKGLYIYASNDELREELLKL